MHKKRMRQWITLCIVFAMLFSGMYFEKLKVDSQFVACNFPDNPAVIRAAEPTAVVAHYRKLSSKYYGNQFRAEEPLRVCRTPASVAGGRTPFHVCMAGILTGLPASLSCCIQQLLYYFLYT